jgi:hypothetical protein
MSTRADRQPPRRAMALTILLLLLSACGGGGGGGSSSKQLVSIAVTSSSADVAAGNTLQLTATGTYSDSSTVNLTSTAAWSSINPNIATVNATSELVTAVAVGSGKITATVGTVSGTITLTITPPAKGWAPAGTLITPRASGFTATLLGNRTVLVAGGYGAGPAALDTLTNAEIYNPGTATWTATGGMATARAEHSATLLPDGTVLVAGGTYCAPGGCAISGVTPLASAEIFNPATGTWSATGGMVTARYGFLATLLPNGTVLVAGGTAPCGTTAQCPTTAAEIYDPAAGTWASTSTSLYAATYPPGYFQATVLPDQTALALGAVNGVESSTPVAEIYNMTAGTWASVAAPTFGPNTATLLPDGTVLAAGGGVTVGESADILDTAEIYTPSAATWAQTGSMNDAREVSTATLLADGTVLVAGGFGCSAMSCQYPGAVLNSAEIYYP